MNRILFLLILAFVLIASIVNGYMNLNDSDWADNTYRLWNFSVAILFAFWAVKDQEAKGSKYLDLGYLYFFAWPVVLPIYLVKSRGMEQGITMFLGFVMLATLPWLSGVVVYAYFT